MATTITGTTIDVGTNVIVTDSAGNVGIGTASPNHTLDVKAATGNGISITPTSGGATNYLSWYDTGSGPYGRIGYNHSASAMTFTTVTTERMRIDSSGNVLVGTTQAFNALNGRGNLVVGSGTGNEGITIYTGSTGSSGLVFADGIVGSQSYTGQISYEHSVDAMTFAVNGGTERMRIDSSGNVLVGTTVANGLTSNGSPVVAGRFTTQAANTSTTSGVATTLVTFGDNSGNFLVSARLSGTGAASTDNTTGIVHINGSTSTYTALVAGSRMVLSMSGLNLQGTQTLFTGANIGWNVIKISF